MGVDKWEGIALVECFHTASSDTKKTQRLNGGGECDSSAKPPPILMATRTDKLGTIFYRASVTQGPPPPCGEPYPRSERQLMHFGRCVIIL